MKNLNRFNESDISDVSGYVIRFDEPDMNGQVFTKNSFNYSQFDKMKERGDIVDYLVDDKGVKIIKRISRNDLGVDKIGISSRGK
jgi:phage head maturation protease